jgi:hypothetical protein
VHVCVSCWDSIVDIVTFVMWMVWGLGPGEGGGEIFCAVQTGPRAHPASCTAGIVLLTTHPPCSTEFEEWVELYLYTTICAFVACYRVNFILYKPVTKLVGEDKLAFLQI